MPFANSSAGAGAVVTERRYAHGYGPKVFQVAADTPLSATVKPGTWPITGSMHQPRSVQPATLLANGEILVAGGMLIYCFQHQRQ
jgi:hypothetical protein